ncbi:MAG TPA: hypothetical protein VGJ60_07590 [Chloroflexota bacterium]|jgi:hypothetical protein
MARLLTCGWETGDPNEAGTNFLGPSAEIFAVNSTPVPRAGNWCCRMGINSISGADVYKTFNFGARTEVWVRWAAQFRSPQLAGGTEWMVARLRDSGGTAVACLTYSRVDGFIRARQGGATNTTLLGTSQSAPLLVWHTLEWRHQMTSLTQGITELWVNGSQQISFSGDNSAGTLLNVAQLDLGVWGSTRYWWHAVDDLAINDTTGAINNGRPGDGRVVLLTPNAVGSSTTWLRLSGPDSGANWSQVDDNPMAMTDYVESFTIGDRDLYAVADLPAITTSVNAVDNLVLAQAVDVGASLAPTIKSGTTINEAAASALTTTPAYVRTQYETDPNTSAAWTPAAVNAAEVGITAR